MPESDIALIRLPDVIRRTGLSKSSIYAKEAAGEFPSRVKQGPRTTCWRLDEIIAYIEQRTAAQRSGT